VKIHNCKSNAIRSNAAVNYKLKTVMQLCMKISRNQLLRGFAHEDNLWPTGHESRNWIYLTEGYSITIALHVGHINLFLHGCSSHGGAFVYDLIIITIIYSLENSSNIDFRLSRARRYSFSSKCPTCITQTQSGLNLKTKKVDEKKNAKTNTEPYRSNKNVVRDFIDFRSSKKRGNQEFVIFFFPRMRTAQQYFIDFI